MKENDLTDDDSGGGDGEDGGDATIEDSGVQAEVDMFMARGGYQVTYIGSLSVITLWYLI